MDLARAVGGHGRLDVPPGTREVAGQEVAPRESGADLTLLQPVAVAPRRVEGVPEGVAGAVDEPGLEEHFAVVEPGPVPGDRGVHPVGGAHQHERPGEVAVDEGEAGEVVPGLELLVHEPVLGRGADRPRQVGVGLGAVPEAEVGHPAVDEQGAELSGLEHALVVADLVQGHEAGCPVAAADVDDALLHVAQRDEEPVVDGGGARPGVMQHPQCRAEAVDLELGPGPGDEDPDPELLDALPGGPVEGVERAVELVDSSVEATHLVVVPCLGEEGVGDSDEVLDGLPPRARSPA